MAITTNAICNTFKKQLLEGDMEFQFGGDKFKLALYTSTAVLGASTTSFTTSGEVTNPTGTYTSGGGLLIQPNPSTSLSASTAICTFNDLSFTGVTITARGALIYNSSSATTNAAVAVLDFVTDKTATAGTFTIQFPAFTASSAILRIS
jgi:hypothetical protein